MKRKLVYSLLVISLCLVMNVIGAGTSAKPTNASGPMEPTATAEAGRRPMSWEQIGPRGISVWMLAAQDPNTLFIGTDGGIYKSVDGGQSWQLRNQGMGTMSISKLITSGRNKDILFAGTVGGGLYRSNNDGDSWHSWHPGIESPARFVTELVASDDGQTLYFGASGDGVYRSTNWGEDWQLSSNGLDRQADIGALTVGGHNGQTLWLGTSNGELFQSTDGGNNWSKRGHGLDNVQITALMFGDIQGQILYAGTDKGVYQSKDGGESWQGPLMGAFGLQIGRVHTLVNQDGRLWAGGGGGLYVSDNGGATWQKKTRGLPEDALVVTVLATVGDRLYAGTSGYGVFVSNDGGEIWDERNRGLVGNTLYIKSLLLTDQKTTTLYAGTQGAGVFKSTDRGNTWTPVNHGLPDPFVNTLAIGGTEKQVLYAATWSGVFRLQEDESQWKPAGLAGIRIQDLVISNEQRDTLIAGSWGEGILQSTDGGMTWETVNEGLSHPYISTLAIDHDRPNLVYAGTWGEGIFSSRDEGRTWQPIEAAGIDPRIHKLAVGHGGDLYVATTTTLSKRSATGEWSHLLLGEYNAIVIDPVDTQIVFAGGAAGSLVFTQDGGETWNELSTVDADVTDFVLDPREEGLLFVATSGRSIFRGTVDPSVLPPPRRPPIVVLLIGLIVALSLLSGVVVILSKRSGNLASQLQATIATARQVLRWLLEFAHRIGHLVQCVGERLDYVIKVIVGLVLVLLIVSVVLGKIEVTLILDFLRRMFTAP